MDCIYYMVKTVYIIPNYMQVNLDFLFAKQLLVLSNHVKAFNHAIIIV